MLAPVSLCPGWRLVRVVLAVVLCLLAAPPARAAASACAAFAPTSLPGSTAPAYQAQLGRDVVVVLDHGGMTLWPAPAERAGTPLMQLSFRTVGTPLMLQPLGAPAGQGACWPALQFTYPSRDLALQVTTVDGVLAWSWTVEPARRWRHQFDYQNWQMRLTTLAPGELIDGELWLQTPQAIVAVAYPTGLPTTFRHAPPAPSAAPVPLQSTPWGLLPLA